MHFFIEVRFNFNLCFVIYFKLIYGNRRKSRQLFPQIPISILFIPVTVFERGLRTLFI